MAGKRILNEEDVKTILWLRSKGYTYKIIAAKMYVSRGAIASALKKFHNVNS